MCLKYLHPDSELQNYAVLVMDMLRSDTSVDAQALVSDVKQYSLIEAIFAHKLLKIAFGYTS